MREHIAHAVGREHEREDDHQDAAARAPVRCEEEERHEQVAASADPVDFQRRHKLGQLVALGNAPAAEGELDETHDDTHEQAQRRVREERDEEGPRQENDEHEIDHAARHTRARVRTHTHIHKHTGTAESEVCEAEKRDTRVGHANEPADPRIGVELALLDLLLEALPPASGLLLGLLPGLPRARRGWGNRGEQGRGAASSA